MEDFRHYERLAASSTLASFERETSHLFLCRMSTADLGESDGPLAFKTAGNSSPGVGSEEQGMLIRAVRKREGNPYPERFSVGRATNCDIVLRMAVVSKLHGHLTQSGGRLLVSDNRSSNGTWVNGVAVTPGDMVPVEIGAELRFGTVKMLLLSVTDLYRMLRAQSEEESASKSPDP